MLLTVVSRSVSAGHRSHDILQAASRWSNLSDPSWADFSSSVKTSNLINQRTAPHTDTGTDSLQPPTERKTSITHPLFNYEFPSFVHSSHLKIILIQTSSLLNHSDQFGHLFDSKEWSFFLYARAIANHWNFWKMYIHQRHAHDFYNLINIHDFFRPGKHTFKAPWYFRSSMTVKMVDFLLLKNWIIIQCCAALFSELLPLVLDWHFITCVGTSQLNYNLLFSLLLTFWCNT